MSGYRNMSIKWALKRNGRRTCCCCSKPRHLLSTRCLHHYNVWARTGNSFGKLYYASDFALTRIETAECIRRNRNHILISSALGFLDRVLFRSTRTGNPKLNNVADRYVRRLAEAEVDIFSLFSLLAAVGVEHFRHHSRFTDLENMKRNMANLFIRFVPHKSKHLQTTACRQLGNLLWDRLGKAILVIKDACDRKEEENRKRKQLEKVEFKISD